LLLIPPYHFFHNKKGEFKHIVFSTVLFTSVTSVNDIKHKSQIKADPEVFFTVSTPTRVSLYEHKNNETKVIQHVFKREDDEGIPFVSIRGGLIPNGVYEDLSNVDILGNEYITRPQVSISWGKMVYFYQITKYENGEIKFEKLSEIELKNNIMGSCWLSEQVLSVLDNTNKIVLIDTLSVKVVDKFEGSFLYNIRGLGDNTMLRFIKIKRY
jgi:hypothetical protein